MNTDRRRRDTNAVVTIYWRDIPAQVNGQRGRERSQILLSDRFQRAVDRAKRKAKITTAQADVAQWRRDTQPCTGDPFEAAAAHAAQLEVDYSDEHLGRLGFVGGFEADTDTAPADLDVNTSDTDDVDPSDDNDVDISASDISASDSSVSDATVGDTSVGDTSETETP